jgi:hypothetical protein
LCDAGYILYDSTVGNKPKLFHTGVASEENVPIYSFVDTEGKDVDVSAFNAKMQDEEFWRKELYKCKQSPMYYFTSYVSENPKPTQGEIDAYLKSIGFEKTNDSETAAEINEKTRLIREAFSQTITMQKLQDLKPVRDKMDEEYLEETKDLQERVAEFFDISSTHDAKIKEKTITYLMKIKPKDSCEDMRYYVNEKTGRWDGSLLKATDIDVLLRLWEKSVSL